MGDLINSTYISLDGVIEKPQNWPATGGFGAKGNQIQTEMVLSCSAILMGRRTYQSFAEVWPTLSGDPLVDRMNAMPKYVASGTLTDPAWNNTRVITGDLVTEVAALKDGVDDAIVQFGFGPTTHLLMAAGLLDRLRLWIHPFIIGSGAPEDLLYRDAAITQFELTGSTTLDSGIVVLDYRTRV